MSFRTTTIAEIASPAARSIAIGPFGSSLKADMYTSTGVPVVRGQNLTSAKEIDLSDVVYVAPETASKFPACMLEEGDLVFPHRGAIGRVGLVGVAPALLSSSMMKLKCDPSKADPRFVLYYFRGPGRRELMMRASTVGTPGIGQPLTSLREIPIPLPSLEEQRGIAEVLGSLDDKIATNAKLADTAAELARALFDQGMLGVEMRPMNEVLNPILGGTPPRSNQEFWEGPFAWASARDITSATSGVVVSTLETITDSAISRTKAKPLPTGSVILTARGTVGAVARLAVPASFNQSCYGFTPSEVPSSILYLGILNAMQRAKAVAHGSVFDTITMKTFDHLDFPIFEKEESERLDRDIAPLLDAVVAKVKENETLAELRDTLLPEFMSGRLQLKGTESVAPDVV